MPLEVNLITEGRSSAKSRVVRAEPGELTTHDLRHFDLSGMIQCGRLIRSLSQRAKSMEGAAQLMTSAIRDSFIDPCTRVSDCALVRCFKTHKLGQLPSDLRSKARSLVSDASVDQLPCLTLLATVGDLDGWNDRSASTRHAVIPLESIEVVERAPMIAQLIRQMGLEIGSVLDPSEELLIEADQRAYGVFHVADAMDSPSIPAQDFVETHKIKSVLGFGGLLPSGDLFSVIVFSRVHISREIANLFKTIALSAKLLLLPFSRGPFFADERLVDNSSRTAGYDDEQIRSEIATLRLLIPALEDAALSQTTRLKGAVADLELRAEEVHKLGARLSAVLESTTDAVFMLDRQWRFTYSNRHAFKLLHSDVQLIGKNVWEEFPAAIDSSFWTNYQRAMTESIPVKFEEYYPAPLDRWFEVHVFPSDEGIAVFFHDVTERRLANEALIRNEKLAAVGRLAASIAHEINNPLESVTNLLFLAQECHDLTKVKDYLVTADRELRRIGAITSQTLRFHKQASNPTEVNCAEIINGVLSVYQGRIFNSRVQVEVRIRTQRRINCFEGELRQVLNNLVANAIDAVPIGGRLLLREREGTDWKTGRQGVFLTVADNGAGMSEQTRAKLFEAFFSTKGAGGTGLGLWITKGIIERHEGRIFLRSSRRKGHSGTAFAVFLPFERMGERIPK